VFTLRAGDDKRRGVTLTGRDAWEQDKKRGSTEGTPGPQSYAPPADTGEMFVRAPSHSMVGRSLYTYIVG